MSTAQLAPSTAVAAAANGPRRRRRLGPERINWWATAFIAVAALTVLVPLYLAVVVGLSLVILVLVFRPQGLMGAKVVDRA